MSMLLQTLLAMNARMDVLNERNQTPFDMCITDAAREMLQNYTFAFKTMMDKKAAATAQAAPSSPAARYG